MAPQIPDHVVESVTRMLGAGKVTFAQAIALMLGARTDGDNPDVYECDGCGLVGTMAFVDAHVGDTCRWPDGSLKDPGDTVCFGGMLVGGRAWVEYHTKGLHPMDYIVDQVRDLTDGQDD